MKFIHTSISKTGLKRKNNEDALGVFNVDDGLLAIVCDGLGGNKGGEIASALSVEVIYSDFKESNENDYLLRIRKAIETANTLLITRSSKDPEINGMATTAEVVFIKDDTIYWGHVGDSRIYHLKNEKLKQITKDHSLVQQLVDEGHLTLHEAKTHPNKNIIVRALGDTDTIEIDVSKMKLDSKINHKFFLCTDGISSVVDKKDLERVLVQNNSLQITEKITSLVEQRGAPDNFSFVLLTEKN